MSFDVFVIASILKSTVPAFPLCAFILAIILSCYLLFSTVWQSIYFFRKTILTLWFNQAHPLNSDISIFLHKL